MNRAQSSPPPPVFLIPFGRSGGTLFVTMLDAHRDVAMSYEIYEDRLIDAQGVAFQPATLISWLESSPDRGGDDVTWIKSLPDKQFQVFLYRARRAGLSVNDVLKELHDFAASGARLQTLDDRLNFIERLMMLKMTKLGKRIWGGKAKADPRQLHARHPQAKFFTMIRDGRDILASMTKTGSFDADPTRVAKQWADHMRSFRAFSESTGAATLEIRYEQLVVNPELVLQRAAQFIGIPYDPDMLRFDEKDMPLFRNPHGHLSSSQIQRGLNPESIGRWKHDLSAAQVEQFMSAAGDVMRELGYGEADAVSTRPDGTIWK